MATLGTSWAQVHPSRIEPGVLMQINQVSQAMRLVATGAPRVLLDPEDLYVYMRRLAMRARTQQGQTGGNLLPGATLVPDYISTAAYRIRAAAQWGNHDSANMSRWGVNIAEGYRLANRQGIFQTLRNMLLYGYNPTNNEGFLNAPGAVAVTLPPDSFGNTTLPSYDNGELAVFFLNQWLALKDRTYQLGIPRRGVIVGPQRVIGQMKLVNVVQVTSYQRIGAGTATTAEMIEEVAKRAENDVVEFGVDDTLIGQGAGGADMVIMQMAEVEQPVGSEWNTNEFAKLEPNLAACALQYADMAAPLEVTVPVPPDGVHTLYEIRATSGWPVRPEATSLLSIPY